MADITMCLDDSCPSRFTCKRHVDSGTPWAQYWQAVGDTHHDLRGNAIPIGTFNKLKVSYENMR